MLLLKTQPALQENKQKAGFSDVSPSDPTLDALMPYLVYKRYALPTFTDSVGLDLLLDVPCAVLVCSTV